MGIDGITFLNGTLYVNNVIFEQALPHPSRRRWQSRDACRYLDGPAGKGP